MSQPKFRPRSPLYASAVLHANNPRWTVVKTRGDLWLVAHPCPPSKDCTDSFVDTHGAALELAIALSSEEAKEGQR